MGYYVHITRAEGWSESEKFPITKDEWQALIVSDPELRLSPDYNHRFAESTANWVDPESGKERDFFGWSKGEIFTKNLDRPKLAKMLQIADRFGAQVQDDYGFTFTKPEDVEDDPSIDWAAENRSTWWWAFGTAMFCLCNSIIGSWLVGWFSLFFWAMTGLLLFYCWITFRS